MSVLEGMAESAAGRLTMSTIFWIVIPMTAGVVRVIRKEVN